MEQSTEKGLKQALSCLESGNPAQAQKIIETLFEGELESLELMYTALCCTFWKDTIAGLSHVENPYERGEILLNGWKSFLNFISKQKNEYKPAFFATQKGIFTIALENYSNMLAVSSQALKSEVYRKAGLCYKKLGSYENACSCLLEANNIQSGQAEVISELADCYSLCGDERSAKVLFREAFFIAPEKVDLDLLESGIIRSIIERLEVKKFSKRVLCEWIPVYGIIYGIFNVKRELSAQEVGKLKQDIYSMENEIKNPYSDQDILTPRLLACYFRLIDQYVMKSNNNILINEVLLKIKILDSNIYDLYVR